MWILTTINNSQALRANNIFYPNKMVGNFYKDEKKSYMEKTDFPSILTPYTS